MTFPLSTVLSLKDGYATPARRGSRRGILRGMLTILYLLITWAMSAPSFSQHQDIAWEQLNGGLAVSVWKPGGACGNVALLVTDVDPEHYRFSVHNYTHEGLSQPPTIEEWQKRTGDRMIFNAGLFRENFAYLGLLYKDSKSLGGRRHPAWQGLFVAEPTALARKKARVLDLSVESFDEQRPPYREAAQALMLVERTGKIRVRDTEKRAYQTVVAELRNGHILIVKSLGLVTLYDIGRCLRDHLSDLHQAMAMDGGSSSDILIPESLWPGPIRSPLHADWKSLFSGAGLAHSPLPTVIGISPR